jgi:hypothetical protein
MFRTLSAAAAAAFLATPAAAQVSVDLGVGARVDLDSEVGVRVGEPYRYRGYSSERWYWYEDPGRAGVWYAEYGGYDCRRGFYYTWAGDDRVRWESYWCYDDRGRDFEVRRTRVVARID